MALSICLFITISFTFLLNFLQCTEIPIPCISTLPQERNYTHLQNTNDWGGYLLGYCEGLFGPDDLIQPIESIGCRGEVGNMTLIRKSAGTLKPACRKAISKYFCYLFLPKYRENGLFALPCTNEQANVTNTSPKTLWDWVSVSCADSIENLERAGLKAAFVGVDDSYNSFTGTITRPICRVIDEGDLERPEDHFPNWKPELWECAKGMVKVNEEDQNDESMIGCAFPCPGPFFSDSQWDQLLTLMGIPNFISMICAFACGFLLLRMPEKRKFPANLVILLNFYAGIIEFAFAFSLFSEWGGGSYLSSVLCQNDYTIETRLVSWCGLQGSILLFAAKGIVVCWLLILVNLYIVITRGKRESTLFFNKKHSSYYFTAAIGYPLIPLICAIGTLKVGSIYASSNCLIVSDERGLYQYLFFFGDMFLFGVIGLVLTTLLMLRLKRTKMSLASGRARSTLFSIKIFLMLIYVFVTVCIVVYQRIDGSVTEDLVAESVTEYVTCLIVQFVSTTENFNESPYVENPADYSSCKIKHVPSYAISFLIQIIQCGLGMYLFFLFGIGGVRAENRVMLWIYSRPFIGHKIAAIMGYSSYSHSSSKHLGGSKSESKTQKIPSSNPNANISSKKELIEL
eukprot:c21932_g2_i4.p1 GENE.c21932_g2_i4~~c21932_g2_i4.p1  ORF type:complete len:627 (-),score=178.71 c21932_g2_i4:104-1984(-)